MASKTESSGKALVIVESPAKARTIGKFLGRGFTVEASIGHVRDLPQGAKEVPAEFKKEDWAYLGVNVQKDFEPIYIVPAEKKKQVSKLKQLLKESSDLYLATDEDREGEAISWHLHELLKPRVPVRRLVFHEITEEAIREALAHPRDIDTGLVKAQETRRILDRLYGFDVSQLLWKKVGPGLSAGRVQSVAVRLIVERERERIAFHSATYWDLLGRFATAKGESIEAALVSVDGRRIPTANDFDEKTGRLKGSAGDSATGGGVPAGLLLLDEAGAKALAERLRRAEFRVTAVDEKPFTERPKPPFTTSTMQQEANRKLGYTARRTMRAAQSLYENGHITYMRTDSTTLAQVAVDAARDLVASVYGPAFLPAQPRTYASSVKNAQEAHEAIRPAGHPFEKPDALRGRLGEDEYRLFELIWKRTIASQMNDARKRRTTITIEGGGAVFKVSGTSIEFEGFLRAYVEGSDDPDAELADQEKILPTVARDERLDCRDLPSKSHTTKPPARYTEATLTRELEQRGIGRPSTFASIIDTIQNRDYVFKKGNALVPSWLAFSVTRLLEDHLPSLVDYDFTAQMEDYLDAISRREAEHLEYLRRFYFGNGDAGLKQMLDEKVKSVDARLMSRFTLGEPEGADPVVVRVGKYGPFLEQGERKASIPTDMPPDELTLGKALELLEMSQQTDAPLGHEPDTGRPVFLKQGRFGPYVQLGSGDDGGEKPKNASLLKGMEPSDVTLEVALQLLALPRDVGAHPESGEPIVAHNGRYGPYIKCGSETRSLPAGVTPLEVTVEQSVALLAQPKTRGRGAQAAPREPLKTYEASPVTGEPIRLLDGRYGPYVTDGTTNASLPRDADPAALTFEQAVALLAERAERAPATKKRGGRKSAASGATKKSATKKAAPKKSAAKKATAKKATAKKAAGKKSGSAKSSADASTAGSPSDFDDIPFDADE